MNDFSALETFLASVPPIRLWRYSAHKFLHRPSPEDSNPQKEKVYFIEFNDAFFAFTVQETVYGTDSTCRFYFGNLETVKFHFCDCEENHEWILY